MYLPNGSWASTKTVYDPCPAGWRVPEGGVWANALGKTKDVNVPSDYENRGINYTGAFGADETIWYPCSGCRNYSDGYVSDDSNSGYSWSCSPDGNSSACYMSFFYNGDVFPLDSYYRGNGYPVRCLQE